MATRVSTTNLDDIKLTHIKLEVDGDGIAVMTFDSQDQKVNTLSLAVADDFDTVMDRVESEKSIRALVITSAKKGNFIAGADISLIRNAKTAAESTQMARSLQDRFMRLEEIHTRLKKPVVVAIDGSCMGGGTEMSLACSMRLASNEKHTVIALPEVQLGVFPGAGGTQRLPRLIGIANALDVILTGKNLRPKKALKLGLVDEIMPAAILLETAKKRALAAAKGERKGPKRGLARLKELANEFSDPDHLQQLVLEENIVGRNLLFKKAKEALLKKTLGNYPGPEKALEVIRVGIEEGLEAGYAAEADRFGQLAVSDQAQALMGIFFATTELKRDNGVDDDSVEAKPVKKLAMLGSGLMGGGIATMSVTKAKVPVRLKDINDEGIRSGLAYVGKILAKDVKRRRKSRVEADQIMQMITTTQDYSGFGDVDLVIEAVPEVLELKRKVLKDVE
ncbi:enoyl-CoA hydratase/isomerase family protein, partial [Myxococcota bacterium]|nr:enoyl-CoA hydratase/isomerase family protein [Myxococcota bacterium]